MIVDKVINNSPHLFKWELHICLINTCKVVSNVRCCLVLTFKGGCDTFTAGQRALIPPEMSTVHSLYGRQKKKKNIYKK